MARFTQIGIGLLLWVFSTLATAVEVSEVVILATGGTIAGVGDSSISSSYKAARLPIEELLNSVAILWEPQGN